LELAVTVGFLAGTYLLARENPLGWVLFMVMNASMATLQGVRGNWLLTLQQIVSLGFVVYGYWSVVRVRAPQVDAHTST
ncbi:MAG: hypothetical protein AAF125_26445, partial [Chloroflexota bacterium]